MRAIIQAISIGLLLAIILVLPLNAVPTPASSSIDSLRQQQQQTEQQRSDVSQERHRLSNLQQATQQNLNGLQQNLKTTGIQIKDNESQLQIATQRLKELQTALAEQLSHYQEHQAAAIARLRFLQRSAVNQGWTVLLQSENLTDFFDRRRQLQLIYQADQKILANLTKEAKRLKQQKTAVEQQTNEIDLIGQQLLMQKADFEAQAQSQQELVQRLNTDRLALEAAETQLTKDSESLGQLIQQRVAEQEAKEEAAHKKTDTSNIIIRGTGQLSYPCDAPTTSEFGWRLHPILGYRRFHSGLDFGATYGSTVRAADTGTVIFAGWYGGYGNAVIINHGHGMTTLYGHTSQLYVSEGQVVQRGQAIAAVGSTGLSTGPHLHFEVRRDGTPVDPRDYL